MKVMFKFRLITLVALAGLGSLVSACDGVAEYSVTNQTSETLITRPVFRDDCSQTGGFRSDYLDEKSVPPMSTTSVEYVYGAGLDTVRCIQVLTTDRQIVLADEYSTG